MSDKKRLEMLFDVRTIIALLFGVYGAVCLIWGLAFNGATDKARSGNINVNLWTGLAMLAFAASFLAWALWRPLEDEVPDDVKDDDGKDDDAKGDADPDDDNQGRRGSPSASR
jgi:hypothetical protein